MLSWCGRPLCLFLLFLFGPCSKSKSVFVLEESLCFNTSLKIERCQFHIIIIIDQTVEKVQVSISRMFKSKETDRVCVYVWYGSHMSLTVGTHHNHLQYCCPVGQLKLLFSVCGGLIADYYAQTDHVQNQMHTHTRTYIYI